MGMMGILLLAAEASAAHSELAEGAEGGFGLNFDILEANLINLTILIGVLIYFGRKVLTKTLTERRTSIEVEIKAAEKSASEAAAALADAQQKLTQAQAEAQKIRKNAEENAQTAREAILTRAAQDVEQMKANAAQDLDSERNRAIAQLRQQVVAKALEKVESQLENQVDGAAQQKLVDRSIALLGGSR